MLNTICARIYGGVTIILGIILSVVVLSLPERGAWVPRNTIRIRLFASAYTQYCVKKSYLLNHHSEIAESYLLLDGPIFQLACGFFGCS